MKRMSLGGRARAALTGLILSTGLVFSVRAEIETTQDDDHQFREDVILCEEAVAHAESCCPGLHAASDACAYKRWEQRDDCGCSTGTRYRSYSYSDPVLSSAESEKVLGTSCGSLRADACVAVGELLRRTHTSSATSTGECH